MPRPQAPAARTAGISTLFTSEAVSEGHPDKVCDYIADAILDAHLAQDAEARVACEVLCKAGDVVLAGEISSGAVVDHVSVAREAIREIGYIDSDEPFNAGGVRVRELISQQSPEIAQGVDAGRNESGDLGAGDQGLMFGYATDETPELMPLPLLLAHRVSGILAQDRHAGRQPWLRPDAKSQVTVRYLDGSPAEVTHLVVSIQHRAEISQDAIEGYVREDLAPRALGRWATAELTLAVNATGSFVEGGPSADCGVTGRKIIVDSYGGRARHGGGAFSGKDPSKVDRSAAYFCRFVARQLVRQGYARRVELQVAYVIGQPRPVSLSVETFGTGDTAAALEFIGGFDFRPAAIIERLRLRRPIYRGTTNYGHFGRAGLPWEAD
ncbi:MAG: methionine adenosyltransferase [Gemmatimonadetes bacterium]|nr:methionine adenosyltransferase [Gemmatimonadota bacterium]